MGPGEAGRTASFHAANIYQCYTLCQGKNAGQCGNVNLGNPPPPQNLWADSGCKGSGNALFLAKKGLGMRADIRSPLDPALEDTPATHGLKRKTHPHPCPAPLCSRPSQAPISLTPPLQRGVGVRRAVPAVLTASHPRGKPLKRLQRPRRFYTPG